MIRPKNPRIGKWAAMSIAAAAMTAGLNGAAAEDALIIRGGEHLIEVRRVEHHLHRGEGRRLTKVVTIEVEDRVMTLAKARALASLSDRDDLIHVEVVHENVLLDPHKDYIRQNEYAVNENDLIPSAHRLALGLRANKASIVFGSPNITPMNEVHEPSPMMIIERPQGDAPRRIIPSVPAPPKKSEKPLMVMAGK